MSVNQLPSPTPTTSTQCHASPVLSTASSRASNVTHDSDDELDNHHYAPSASRNKPSALEIRREKNRIKQRNLRERRANHMADLEATVNDLKSKKNELEQFIAEHEARSGFLTVWVDALESALVAHGQRRQVIALRRTYATKSGVDTPAADLDAYEEYTHKSERRGDSLAALASAASSFNQTGDAPQFHSRDMPQVVREIRERPQWETDVNPEPPSKQRRVMKDVAPAPQLRLPSPSHTHLADRILPPPRELVEYREREFHYDHELDHERHLCSIRDLVEAPEREPRPWSLPTLESAVKRERPVSMSPNDDRSPLSSGGGNLPARAYSPSPFTVRL